DLSAATAYYEESLAISREIGDKQGIACSLYGLGGGAYRQGDYSAARALHEESLSIKREIANKRGIAESLECFAFLAAQERPERAAGQWGAAERLREEIGIPLPPNEREEYDREVAKVQKALGEAAFASAWAEGSDMTMEQAIEFALSESEKGP